MVHDPTRPNPGWPAPDPAVERRPFGVLAAVVGIVAAFATFHTPVVAYVVPGALGTIAVGIAVGAVTAAGEKIGLAAVTGILSGLVAVGLAFEAHGEYEQIMSGFGGLGL